jgi:hypothetical protein
MELTEEQIKILNILLDFYQKPADTSSPLLYSTAEIFLRLQSVYPSEKYEPQDVYNIMRYSGFDFIDSTSRKILWMIQEKV